MPRSVLSVKAPAISRAASTTAEEARRQTIESAYRTHGPRIARRILAYTGEPESVEDLLNETFIRAFERLDGFQRRSELSTWLFGIAINVARAHVTKRQRRRRLDAQLPPPVGTGSSIEVQVRERAAVERLYRALDALSDDLRAAFILCVLEQRSLKDASALLGVPISTLHARRTRAETFVRAQIEEGSGS